MKAYLTNPNAYNYGMWNAPDPADVNGPFGPGVPGEGGVDLTSPTGTPVYAMQDGDIIGSGYWRDRGHGVVTIRCNVPGHGTNDMYYQHIIIASGMNEGVHVLRGKEIGTTGQYGEVEIGCNANWGQPWGLNHPQGWVKDPRPQIKACMSLGTPTGVPDTTSTSGANNSTVTGTPQVVDPGGILSETGQWVAVNILKENPVVVQATNSFLPYQFIGAAVFGLAATIIILIFVTLIGLT